MALQVTTGPGSLVALGVGVGDVYSLITLGQRVGNWWTAIPGDREFLALLDQDEFEIIRRQGLIDLPAFNKRWRKQIRLLANGRAMSFQGSDAENVVEDMGRFTAAMVCIVAALDSFAALSVVKRVLKSMLTELLKTTETGEDLLSSQYASRLNAWRSSACLRGLFIKAQAVRQALVDQEVVMSGYMPVEESTHMSQFLVWLLSNETAVFTTASSDVAGVATCLSELGIDIICIEGKGFDCSERPCRVVYSKETLLCDQYQQGLRTNGAFMRQESISVSVIHPEECISIFPTTIAVHNRCRSAWKSGQQAARFVSLDVVRLEVGDKLPGARLGLGQFSDIYYTFTDRGTGCERTSSEVNDLAVAHAPVVNNEILSALEHCFEHESSEILAWLGTQTRGVGSQDYDILDPDMLDRVKINAFCAFQSFFMGYYYDIFFRVVDTSSLKLQTVEGSWGFRSPDFLFYVRTDVLSQASLSKAGKKTNTPETVRSGQKIPATDVSRQVILQVLSRLFLNHPKDIPLISSTSQQSDTWCIGIIAKRTLVINSLLGKCHSMEEIGHFTLLDVDVGGIPRDPEGLIRPGVPDGWKELEVIDSVQEDVAESAPAEDVTLHIEADWEANPDTTLLCVRYKGRRITTISPARADRAFWEAYVEPTRQQPPQQRTRLQHAIPAELSHLMESPPRLIMSRFVGVPVLFQAFNKVRLRYTAVALYDGCCNIQLASDCVEAALARGNEWRERIRLKWAILVIAGVDL